MQATKMNGWVFTNQSRVVKSYGTDVFGPVKSNRVYVKQSGPDVIFYRDVLDAYSHNDFTDTDFACFVEGRDAKPSYTVENSWRCHTMKIVWMVRAADIIREFTYRMYLDILDQSRKKMRPWRDHLDRLKAGEDSYRPDQPETEKEQLIADLMPNYSLLRGTHYALNYDLFRGLVGSIKWVDEFHKQNYRLASMLKAAHEKSKRPGKGRRKVEA